MTGDTFIDEKTPRTPVSPTNTDTSTLQGDAIIEIGEDVVDTPRPSSHVDPAASGESAQPGE